MFDNRVYSFKFSLPVINPALIDNIFVIILHLSTCTFLQYFLHPEYLALLRHQHLMFRVVDHQYRGVVHLFLLFLLTIAYPRLLEFPEWCSCQLVLHINGNKSSLRFCRIINIIFQLSQCCMSDVSNAEICCMSLHPGYNEPLCYRPYTSCNLQGILNEY